MQEETQNQLKKTSIRGRVASAISCLEMYLNKLQIQESKAIQNLLLNLWKFTNSKALDEWEEEIMEYNLDSIIMQDKRIDLDDSQKLSTMINLVIDIGRNNLYSGTGEYSECTLISTLELLKIIENNGLPLPDLAPFEKSKFSEVHGWGFEREKSFFE